MFVERLHRRTPAHIGDAVAHHPNELVKERVPAEEHTVVNDKLHRRPIRIHAAGILTQPSNQIRQGHHPAR